MNKNTPIEDRVYAMDAEDLQDFAISRAQDCEILEDQLKTMLDLLTKIGRSACLSQMVSGQCVCFSCEANRLITEVK